MSRSNIFPFTVAFLMLMVLVVDCVASKGVDDELEEIAPVEISQFENMVILGTQELSSALSSGSSFFNRTVGRVVGSEKNLFRIPEVDSTVVFAFASGYIRGFSVGYRGSMDFVASVVSYIPEAALVAANTSLNQAYGILKDKVASTVTDFSAYMNKDSVAVLVKRVKENAEVFPDFISDLTDMFQMEIDISLKRYHISSRYRDVFAVAYASGWLSWNAVAYKTMEGLWNVVSNSKEFLSENSTAKVTLMASQMSRAHKVENMKFASRSFRQPGSGSRGHWLNEGTKNVWKSDIPEVNAITKGKGIHFLGPQSNRMPDFSPWARGSYTFRKGELVGFDDADFDKLYQKIADRKHISKSAARQFVKRNGLTPHHVSCNEIQLVPMVLHEGVPHTGGASMIRNGLCPK